MQADLFAPPSNGRTRVFNVRSVSQRLPDDVYIGRAGHGEQGTWGNPYTRQQHPERALRLYAQHLNSRWREVRSAALALGSHRLLCFCLPKEWDTSMGGPIRCHGQILAVAVDLARGIECPLGREVWELMGRPVLEVAQCSL